MCLDNKTQLFDPPAKGIQTAYKLFTYEKKSEKLLPAVFWTVKQLAKAFGRTVTDEEWAELRYGAISKYEEIFKGFPLNQWIDDPHDEMLSFNQSSETEPYLTGFHAFLKEGDAVNLVLHHADNSDFETRPLRCYEVELDAITALGKQRGNAINYPCIVARKMKIGKLCV